MNAMMIICRRNEKKKKHKIIAMETLKQDYSYMKLKTNSNEFYGIDVNFSTYHPYHRAPLKIKGITESDIDEAEPSNKQTQENCKGRNYISIGDH